MPLDSITYRHDPAPRRDTAASLMMAAGMRHVTHAQVMACMNEVRLADHADAAVMYEACTGA